MGSMSLVLPVVSSTLGPTFATWINTALATIEEHDHTTGKGIKVPSAALNLNADVPLSGYSLYDAKSYRVRDAVSALTGRGPGAWSARSRGRPVVVQRLRGSGPDHERDEHSREQRQQPKKDAPSFTLLPHPPQL